MSTPDRCIVLRVRFEEVQDEIRQALSRLGVSPYRAALDADLPRDAIHRVIVEGRSPGVDRLEAICKAVGLEFYVGPPRGLTPPLPLAAWFRRLAREHKRLNAHGRRRLMERLGAAFPELARSGTKAAPNHVDDNVISRGL